MNPKAQQNPVDDIVKGLKDGSINMVEMMQNGYAEVMKAVAILEETGDPELLEIAQELKTVDPKIFELTPNEEKLQGLYSYLLEKTENDEKTNKIVITTVNGAAESVALEILGAMNEDSRAKWDQLKVHDPNPAQEMYLLNETAKLLVGKDYDTLYEEKLGSAVETAMSMLQDGERISSKIATLNEEQVANIQMKFDEGLYELAIQLIYQYAEEK